MVIEKSHIHEVLWASCYSHLGVHSGLIRCQYCLLCCSCKRTYWWRRHQSCKGPPPWPHPCKHRWQQRLPLQDSSKCSQLAKLHDWFTDRLTATELYINRAVCCSLLQAAMRRLAGWAAAADPRLYYALLQISAAALYLVTTLSCSKILIFW